jgi:O-antigen ligase/polysaccharide polymerase Wzy-like membrane protein
MREGTPIAGTKEASWWWNGRTRMIVFVFGGLLVLGRSATLDLPKVAYLVAAAAVVMSAAIAIWRERDRRDLFMIRPWIAMSIAMAAMIVLSLPVALAHGVGLAAWLRAASPYGVFAAAPIIAFDARTVISPREAVGWMAAAGALAAISFSIFWLEHRGIVDLGIEPLVLPSAQLAYAGFAVAVAFAFRTRNSAAWATAGGLILGVLLVTGTRTTFLLLGVVAILAIVAGRSQWRQVGTAIVVGGAATGLVMVLTVLALTEPTPPPGPPTASAPVASSLPSTSGAPVHSAQPRETARPDLVGERLGSIWDLYSGEGSGQSLKERIAQTRAAFAAFAANPVLGAGPGKVYTWTDSSGLRVNSPTLDTPLMIAAEFGTVGILVYPALISVFAWFIRVARQTTGRGPEHLSVIGLAATFGLTAFLGPPMDDKGAAYALGLVLAIVLSVAAHRGMGSNADPYAS